MGNNAKGKALLVAASVLMLIDSGATFLVSVLGIVMGGVAAGAGERELSSLFLAYFIISLATSAFEIVVAILGLVNRAKPEKAKLCATLGIIVTLIAVFNTILSVTTGQFDFTQIFSVVPPLIYVAGAMQNRSAQL